MPTRTKTARPSTTTRSQTVNTATIALADQAHAATRQSLNELVLAMQMLGGTMRQRTPGPIARRILAKLHDRARTGKLDTCPHITTAAPQPGTWFPWAPGRIRCTPCAGRTADRLLGTAKHRRCDGCKRTAYVMHNTAAQLPAVVAELDGAPASLPPVRVEYGLCPACAAVDDSEV